MTNQETMAGCHAGKYLTFLLEPEAYGLKILKVQEIIGLMTVTAVPRTPDYVRGVINLRGKVIPVIDLRRKFSLPVVEDTERTCVVVVQVAAGGQILTMGLLVDMVAEVLEIKEDQVEPPPAFGVGVDTDFILGLGKVNNRVIMLLDVDRVLLGDEVSLLGSIAE